MSREKLAKKKLVNCIVLCLIACAVLPTIFTREITHADKIVSDIRASAPKVSRPSNMEYVEFSTGNVISWTINGAWVAGNYYEIYLDDTQIRSGLWDNGMTITVNVDGLSKGEHRYKIVVNDGFSGITQDDVTVTVTENYPLVYTIMVSVIVLVALLVALGSRRYQKSPVAIARKARKAEALKREEEAARKAKEAERKAYEERAALERKSKEALAQFERERAERIEREKQAAEEAKMREMFKKFMAEEQGKNAADVDKMFDIWKKGKEKI